MVFNVRLLFFLLSISSTLYAQDNASIPALISNLRQKIKTQAEVVSLKWEASEIQECTTNYKTQWKKTQGILEKLSSLKCWDQESSQRIEKQKQNLSTLLEKNIDEHSLLKISESYADIQYEISYCRTKEFLNDPELQGVAYTDPLESLISLNEADRILLHMLGDPFATGSELEGHQLGVALQLRHKIYGRLARTLKSQSFLKDGMQTEPCPKLKTRSVFPDLTLESMQKLQDQSQTALDLTSAYRASAFSTFESAIKKTVHEKLKKAGDEFYLQGGWTKHAVMWGVKRETDGSPEDAKYTFRIYNSGQGIQFHFSMDLEGRTLFLPYLEKINVSYASLTSKGFLKLLRDIQTITPETTGDDTAFYKALALVLDGRLTTKVPGFEDFFDPQLSGTCTYSSIPFYTKASMSKPLAEFLEFHIQLKYLDEYFSLNEARLTKHDVPFNLARKSLFYFTNILEKASRDPESIIDNGLQKIALERIQHYQSILESANMQNAAASQNTLAKERTGSQSSEAVFSSPSVGLASEPTRESANYDRLKDPLHKWTVERETLVSNLAKTLEYIGDTYFSLELQRRSYESLSLKIAQQTIEGTILKLPLDENFWKNFSSEDLSSVLFALRRFSEYHFSSVMDENAFQNREGKTPLHVLVHMKILTLANEILDLLKTKSPELLLTHIDSLYLPQLKILRGEFTDFAIYDPRWHKEFERMKDYWFKKTSQGDFFDLRSADDKCVQYFESEDQAKPVLAGPANACRSNTIVGYPGALGAWRKSVVENLSILGKGALALRNILALKTLSLRIRMVYGIDLTEGVVAIGAAFLAAAAGGLQGLIGAIYASKILIYEPATQFALSVNLLSETYLNYLLVGRQFYDLRSISFFTKYFLERRFDEQTAKKLNQVFTDYFRLEIRGVNLKVPDVIQDNLSFVRPLTNKIYHHIRTPYEFNCHQNRIESGWVCDFAIFGTKFHTLVERWKEESRFEIGHVKPLKNIFREENLERAKESVVISENLRLREESNILIVKYPQTTGVSFDSFRQLGYISGSKDTQIAQTLGYFTENSHLLEDNEYQALFKKLMFDPGLLAIEARKNRNLSHQLALFLSKEIQNARSKDLNVLLYFLRLNQYFYEQMNFLHKSEGIAFQASEFVNSRNELIQLFRKSEDVSIKIAISRDIIRTYLQEESFSKDEDLAWLLIASVYRRSNTEPESDIRIDLNEEIQGILLQKQNLIKAYLDHHSGPLDLVFQEFGEKPALSWVKDYPNYISGPLDNPNRLNVATAVMILGGGNTDQRIPDTVLDDPYFKLFFNRNPENPVTLGKYFEFRKDSVCYRVTQAHDRIYIQRKWGNRWYQHIHPRDLYASDKKSSLDAIFFPGFSHWVEADGKGPAGSCKETVKEAYVGQTKRQDVGHEMLVFKDLQKIPLMSILLQKTLLGQIQNSLWSLRIENALKIAPNKCENADQKCPKFKLSEWALHPTENDPRLRFFKDFEYPRLVFVWENLTSHKIQIDLPRYGLSFNYDAKSNSIQSDEYGTLIAKDFPSLPQYKRFLSLKKGKDIYYLLPFFALMMKEKKDVLSLERIAPYQILNLYEHEAQHLLKEIPVFAVLENTETKMIKALSVESKFYLAYLYFSYHEYEHSRNALMELRNHQGSYSLVVHKLIEEFFDRENKDDDPRANAVRFFAYSLGIENSNHFKGLSFPNPLIALEDVYKLYARYLSQRPKLNDIFLPEEQELWLYDDPTFRERFSTRYDALKKNNLETVDIQGEPAFAFEPIDWRKFTYSFLDDLNSVSYAYHKVIGVNVLNDPGLQMSTLYEIVISMQSGDKQETERLIQQFFSDIGLGQCENPIEDFLTYLKATRAATKEERSKFVSAAILVIIEKTQADPAFRLPAWEDLEKETIFPSILRDLITNTEQKDSVKLSVSVPDRTTKSHDTPSKLYVDIHPLDPEGISSYFLYSGIQSEEQVKSLISENEKDSKILAAIKHRTDMLKSYFEDPAPQRGEKDEFLTQSLASLRKNFDLKMKKDLKTKDLSLTSTKALEAFRNSMESERKAVDLQVAAYRNTALELLNKKADSWAEETKRGIQNLAGTREKADLNTLIHSYARQDYSALTRYNPSLTSEDLSKLMGFTKAFLVVKSYEQKLQKLVEASNAVLKGIDHWSGISKQSELKNFRDLITQRRAYSIDEHPEFLAFEYVMGFLIRSNQIKALEILNMKEELKKNPDALGALYELIMGGGKTSVFLPLASYLNSDRDTLNMVVLPESLIPSMSAQLEDQMFAVFGTHVEVLDVNRSLKLDDKKVQSILDRLKLAMQERKIVVVSNSTIQSLFLMFIVSLRNESNTSQNSIYLNLFKFLHKHTHVIIDEADMILDIMKAHRFSVGESVAFNKDAFFATVGLYALLIEDKEIAKIADLPFLSEGNPNGEKKKVFNQTYYHSTLKKKIIERLLDNESSKILFFHKLEPLLARQYSELDRKDLETFLNSTDEAVNAHFLNKIQNPLLRGFLAALYTQIHLTLPLTLDKLYKVHYGLYPKSSCMMSNRCPEFIGIPYQAGVPMLGSRFGSDLEALNYTIQSNIEEMDSKPLLKFKLKSMQLAYSKATTSLQKSRIKDQIHEYFPGLPTASFLKLGEDAVNPYILENQTPRRLLKLAMEPIQRQLTMFNTQISTDALIYLSLFGKIQGFSGTLWNYKTFAAFFDDQKVHLSSTLEDTIALITEKSSQEIDILSSTINSNTKARQRIEKKVADLFQSRQLGSVIDQGGLFKGFKNEDVAKAILEHKESPYSRIIFYDSRNNLKFYNSKDASVRDLSNASSDRKVTIAFWDLQHCTGSDLKVAENDEAVLIINKSTIMRDLTQAAWRLRSLHLGQSIRFAVSKYDADYIREYLTEHFYPVQTLKLKDLLFYTFARERTLLQSHIYRSIQLGMKSTFIGEFMSYITNREISASDLQNLYKKAHSLFETELPSNSYAIYGRPMNFNLKADVLADLKAKFHQGIVWKETENIFNTSRIEARLNALEQKGLALLPPRLLTQTHESGTEMEVESELESETELENEVEQEIELVQTPGIRPHFRRWEWHADKLLSGAYLRDLFTSKTELIVDENGMQNQDGLFFSLREGLKADAKTGSGKDIMEKALSADILLSMNAANVLNVDKILPNTNGGYFKLKISFFGTEQKEFNDLLVVLSKSGELEKVAIIDREESHEMGDLLKDNDVSLSYIFLRYNIGSAHFDRLDYNARMRLNEDASFLDNISSNEKFIQLVAQIKFLSGRVNYTPMELQEIERLFRVYPELMDTFESEILKYKQRGRQEFEQSDLKGLMRELGKEEKAPEVKAYMKAEAGDFEKTRKGLLRLISSGLLTEADVKDIDAKSLTILKNQTSEKQFMDTLEVQLEILKKHPSDFIDKHLWNILFWAVERSFDKVVEKLNLTEEQIEMQFFKISHMTSGERTTFILIEMMAMLTQMQFKKYKNNERNMSMSLTLIKKIKDEIESGVDFSLSKLITKLSFADADYAKFHKLRVEQWKHSKNSEERALEHFLWSVDLVNMEFGQDAYTPHINRLIAQYDSSVRHYPIVNQVLRHNALSLMRVLVSTKGVKEEQFGWRAQFIFDHIDKKATILKDEEFNTEPICDGNMGEGENVQSCVPN